MLDLREGAGSGGEEEGLITGVCGGKHGNKMADKAAFFRATTLQLVLERKWNSAGCSPISTRRVTFFSGSNAFMNKSECSTTF